MFLYGTPISSFAAKVRLGFALKRLRIEMRPPPDGYGSPAYRALVPAGTIPALVDGALILPESEAILEYLEETHPAPPLLPRDPVARARIRLVARLADVALDPPLRALFRAPDPELAAPHLARFIDRCGVLEHALHEAGPYARGDAPSLADCGLPIVLVMADALLPRYGLDTPAPPRLARCRAAWAAHPGMGPIIAGYQREMAAWTIRRFGP